MERTGVRGERGYGRSAGVLVLACGHAAFGQAQGMGHWISEVSTQDGDSIVEPGETATVKLWMDMNPSVGEMLPDGTSVHAFDAGVFDIIGRDGADLGVIQGWQINMYLAAGMDGSTDGVSIFDVGLVQIPPNDFSDPIFLLSFEWEPDAYEPFQASYEPFVDVPDKGVGFLLWKSDGTNELWPADQHEIVISVVPSPSVLAAIGLAALSRVWSRDRQ
jgi:hypothetical protein